MQSNHPMRQRQYQDRGSSEGQAECGDTNRMIAVVTRNMDIIVMESKP
jgi:hypothetical protein